MSRPSRRPSVIKIKPLATPPVASPSHDPFKVGRHDKDPIVAPTVPNAPDSPIKKKR